MHIDPDADRACFASSSHGDQRTSASGSADSPSGDGSTRPT